MALLLQLGEGGHGIFSDSRFRNNAILQINPIVEILSGLARGANDRKSDSILGSRPSCAH